MLSLKRTHHFILAEYKCVSVCDHGSSLPLLLPQWDPVRNQQHTLQGQKATIDLRGSACTVNDKSLDLLGANLQLLFHGVKGDLLEFHSHAHECQQAHLGHVLLVRQAWRATRRDH